MLQKYVVYLNRKGLFFNNPQGVQSQGSEIRNFGDGGKKEVLPALQWLLDEANPEAVAFLATVEFSDGLKMLKKELTFIRAAGGIVREPGNKILCIHRLGFWDLPKGKVEKGEELYESAAREVSEETGIPLLVPEEELCRTWHIYQHRGKNVLKETVWYPFFADQQFPLVAQTEEQITEAVWLSETEFESRADQAYPAIVDVFEAWKKRKG